MLYFYTWGLPYVEIVVICIYKVYLIKVVAFTNPGAFFCAVQSAFYNFGADNYYNLEVQNLHRGK